MTVTYAIEDGLRPDEFVDVLERSGLAERRPVDRPDVVKGMVENAALTVTARDETGLLIGVARSVTDFAYCCYLSDLAVDRAYQRHGIGKELIRRTHEAAGGESVQLLLLSAPAGMGYYPRIGMKKLDNCFGIRRK